MTQAKLRFNTIEDYLNYDDGTETRYELVDGVLVEMPSESPLNVQIATYLLIQFASIGVAHYLLSMKTEIQVVSRAATVRYPDLTILTEELDAAMAGKKRSLITAEMPPPALVIEVVSPGEPGEPNYERDYVEKPAEYADRGIAEFWRIDPERQVVTVLELHNSIYQIREFRGNSIVISPTFLQLQLTAEQILRAGR